MINATIANRKEPARPHTKCKEVATTFDSKAANATKHTLAFA